MAYQERVGKEEGEFETRKIIKKKKKTSRKMNAEKL